MLVHMSPREIKGLNDLAMAHGGQLTINPQTGLPEAGFLESILPMVAGFALNAAVPGLGAAMGGFAIPALVGGGVALMSGSLQKGLMAGLGAYGGVNLGEGLATAGADALTTAGVGNYAEALASQGLKAGTPAYGEAASKLALESQKNALAAPLNERLSSGVSELFKNPDRAINSMGGGFNTIKNIGSAAAPFLGAEEVKSNMPKTTTQPPGKIRSYSYNPYGQTYTPTGNYEVPVTAADGGLMGMYDGGYNPDQLNFAQRSEPVVRMASGGIPRYSGATDGSVVGATAPPPQSVEELYTSILGRPSDAGGAAYWQQQFGNTIDQSEIDNFRKAANVEIANRPTATTGATGTTANAGAATTGGAVDMGAATGGAGFAPVNAGIQELYTSVLGRPADAGGAAYWQNQFGNTIDDTERATFMQAATPERQISDMYRNVLGRDADPGGLQYWTSQINAGRPTSDIYNEFLNIARKNPEIVNVNDTINKDFATATTPYTGYRSTDQTNVVDEWIRNTLGREPTEADKRQSWYRDAFNANKSVSDTEKLYSNFQSFAKTDADKTTAQKIKDATASLTARGITEADVLRQTGKTIAELAASGVDLTKGLASASQLLAPGTKAGFDFSSIRKPTTPQTNAPVGTTNPYGNATNPGDITRNPDGSTTITPNIPGRPYGGFSGMEQVRNAYTDGGGSLGYVPYAPKTMEEFNQLYNKQTGGSKQAYDYLTGKADYSATPYTKTGEIMKPYVESVMGVPENIAAKKVLFDPATKKYKTNPDYVPITYNTLGEKVYGLSNNEIVKRSTAGESFAKESGVTYEQISKALNISIDEAKKRYPALATSTAAAAEVAPDPFNYTGNKGGMGGSSFGGTNKAAGGSISAAYASGGMSGRLRPTHAFFQNGKYNFHPAQMYAEGGASQDEYNLGGYSDGGRLLRGPGDGVSDSIPAVIGKKQPARLADGEFVVPARIVSELGNGSTEAGARKLYAMMDRIQSARGKTVGKGKVAKNSRSEKYLPA
jgi:hypothetical protein